MKKNPIQVFSEWVDNGKADGMEKNHYNSVKNMLEFALYSREDFTFIDAGCGTGQLTAELSKRGASVVATDISQSLIQLAKNRIDECYHQKISFHVGDLCSEDLGKFDYIVAMDSLVYYSLNDLTRILTELKHRTDREIIFTVAPRTKLLQAMWYLGKLAPKGDKSPVMVPQSLTKISKSLAGIADINDLGRISSGFYISQGVSCM